MSEENQSRYRPIHAWDENERPRERMKALGARSLSDAEILAILLGSGSAGESAVELSRKMLERHGGVKGLGRCGLEELMGHAGVGLAKASVVMAALELGRRRMERQEERDVVLSSRHAYEHLGRYFRDIQVEQFAVLHMNKRGGVLGSKLHSSGGWDATHVDVRLILKEAILANSSRILVAHNHPSGIAQPSAHDRELTTSLLRAAKTLGVEVCDHLIWCEAGYYSFADQGILS